MGTGFPQKHWSQFLLKKKSRNVPVDTSGSRRTFSMAADTSNKIASLRSQIKGGRQSDVANPPLKHFTYNPPKDLPAFPFPRPGQLPPTQTPTKIVGDNPPPSDGERKRHGKTPEVRLPVVAASVRDRMASQKRVQNFPRRLFLAHPELEPILHPILRRFSHNAK